jgi:ABC-type nitrate/sulfonate/bicarbonate transport system permease component
MAGISKTAEAPPAVAQAGRPSWRWGSLMPRRGGETVVGALTIAVVIGLWELVTVTHLVSTLYLPTPVAVVDAGVQAAQSGALASDLAASGEEFALGLALAIAVGIPVGILIGWSRWIRACAWPLVMFINAIPMIALTPLFIISLGIGIASKVALVFLGGVIVIVINTAVGVRNLDPDVLQTARSLGASRLEMFRTIALPGSLPFIVTGIRLGIALALIGIVVGEMIAAHAGIGLMIANAGQTYEVPQILLGVIILGLTSVILTSLLSVLERRLQGWRLVR